MALTRLERNQLFEAIAASTLDPAECSLVEIGSKVLISHNRSSSALELDQNSPERYAIDYYVDDGHHYTYSQRALEYAVPVLTKWANEVKEITDAPDLWAELQRSRELLTDIERTDSANTPFTQDEQKQIAAMLQEIKEQLKEDLDLSSEQIERMEERLDEAAEASKRIGRKDWLIYFLGTITALIITATVTAGVGEHIFAMVVQGIAHLFTGGDGPPRILT